jgi:hypothetical protein
MHIHTTKEVKMLKTSVSVIEKPPRFKTVNMRL